MKAAPAKSWPNVSDALAAMAAIMCPCPQLGFCDAISDICPRKMLIDTADMPPSATAANMMAVRAALRKPGLRRSENGPQGARGGDVMRLTPPPPTRRNTVKGYGPFLPAPQPTQRRQWRQATTQAVTGPRAINTYMASWQPKPSMTRRACLRSAVCARASAAGASVLSAPNACPCAPPLPPAGDARSRRR